MADKSVAFDRAATFYDETRGFPPGVEQPVAELIVQAGNLSAQSRVLEIGIGTGRVGLPVSRHTGAYYGIDLAIPMMNRLRAKQRHEPLYLTQADATRLPFAGQHFDAVIAVHVFHLIPNWKQAVAEVARALKPGGLLLNCWNGGQDHPRIARIWDAWNAVIPLERRTQVGAKPDQDPQFLEHEGWQKLGDERVYSYPATLNLTTFVDRMRRRVWSRLWKLTDEELDAGVAAVEAAIAEQFDDPAADIPQTGEFHIQSYTAPIH